MTRLEYLCKVFGWQGGTIHQVNDALSKLLGFKINVLNLPDDYFQELCQDIKLYIKR